MKLIKIVSLAIIVLVVGVAGAVLAFGGKPAASHPAAVTTSPAQVIPPAPSASPATYTVPAVTRTHSKVKILFKVDGTAASGVDITYGSDSDSRSPQGGLGFDGSGSALPFAGTIPYHSSALYFAVSAQLQGAGDITCHVYLKVTNYYSDHTHVTRTRKIASGHASGGFNICDAQYNNN